MTTILSILSAMAYTTQTSLVNRRSTSAIPETPMHTDCVRVNSATSFVFRMNLS